MFPQTLPAVYRKPSSGNSSMHAQHGCHIVLGQGSPGRHCNMHVTAQCLPAKHGSLKQVVLQPYDKPCLDVAIPCPVEYTGIGHVTSHELLLHPSLTLITQREVV